MTKDYKPLNFGKVELAVLDTLREGPLINADLCRALYNKEFEDGDRKTQTRIRVLISVALRALKNKFVVIKKGDKWQIEEPNGVYMLKVLDIVQKKTK